MPDHIHILVGIHATIALSDFVKELKTSTNPWIKNSGKFPDFKSWGKKYAAFTIRYQEKGYRNRIYQKPTRTSQNRKLQRRIPQIDN